MQRRKNTAPKYRLAKRNQNNRATVSPPTTKEYIYAGQQQQELF